MTIFSNIVSQPTTIAYGFKLSLVDDIPMKLKKQRNSTPPYFHSTSPYYFWGGYSMGIPRPNFLGGFLSFRNYNITFLQGHGRNKNILMILLGCTSLSLAHENDISNLYLFFNSKPVVDQENHQVVHTNITFQHLLSKVQRLKQYSHHEKHFILTRNTIKRQTCEQRKLVIITCDM